MKNLIAIVGIFVACISLSTCSNLFGPAPGGDKPDTTIYSSQPNPLFPNTVGTSRKYAVFRYRYDFLPPNRIRTQSFLGHFTEHMIDDTILLFGAKRYRCTVIETDDPFTWRFTWTDQQTVYFAGLQQMPDSIRVLWWKAPPYGASVGQISLNPIFTWYGARPDTLGSRKYKCIALNDTVTTPAGQFRCVVFEEQQRDRLPGPSQDVIIPAYFHHFYYAANVGLVAWKMYDSPNYDIPYKEILYEELLSEYHIAR